NIEGGRDHGTGRSSRPGGSRHDVLHRFRNCAGSRLSRSASRRSCARRLYASINPTTHTDAEPPLPGRQRPVANQFRAAVPRGTGLPVRRGRDPVRGPRDGSRGPDQRRQGSERLPRAVQRRAARDQVVPALSDLAPRGRTGQAGLDGLAGRARVRDDAAGLEGGGRVAAPGRRGGQPFWNAVLRSWRPDSRPFKCISGNTISRSTSRPMRTNSSSRSIDSASCASRAERPQTTFVIFARRSAASRVNPSSPRIVYRSLLTSCAWTRAWTTSSSVTPSARAVVGAPMVRSASRTSCQFPAWRYIIMIVPTPHCSPCNPGFFAIRSRACENLCSLPDAGREEPAIDIATPLDTSALHTNHALSSRRGLIVDAFSITRCAASSLSAAAYDE